MKPRVSILMVTSIDGRLHPSRFTASPDGTRRDWSDDLLRYDVDVSWWVTPSAYAGGYYAKTHRALRQWLAAEYPFWNGYFSNREIPDE